MKIFIYLTIIVLPFISTVYAKPLTEEEKKVIIEEVKEAVEDKKVDSFKISEKGKLKIENWLWQVKVLQEQVITRQVNMREIQAYINRWYDREKYINGIKESEMNSYIYDIAKGMFMRQ